MGRKLYRGWPDVWRGKRHTVVSGRIWTLQRWRVARRLCLLAVVAIGFLVLAAGMIDEILPFPTGLRYRAVSFIYDLRSCLQEMLTAHSELAEDLAYVRGHGMDWHLVGLAFIIFSLRVPVAAGIAACLGICLKRRFTFKVYPDRIVVSGTMWCGALARRDLRDESFVLRVADAREYFLSLQARKPDLQRLYAPLFKVPPAILEIVCEGVERRPLLVCVRSDEAEAIHRAVTLSLRTRVPASSEGAVFA